MKFTRVSTQHEAMQWTGDNFQALVAWGAPVRQAVTFPECLFVCSFEPRQAKIREDQMPSFIANVGDWIVKGILDEYYPVKQVVFEVLYERECCGYST